MAITSPPRSWPKGDPAYLGMEEDTNRPSLTGLAITLLVIIFLITIANAVYFWFFASPWPTTSIDGSLCHDKENLWLLRGGWAIILLSVFGVVASGDEDAGCWSIVGMVIGFFTIVMSIVWYVELF